MADIDTAWLRANVLESGGMDVYNRDVLALCDEIDDLRARLAEVETERDAMTQEAFSRRKEQDRQAKTIEKLSSVGHRLEARLAAVEAVVSAARAWAEKYDKPNRRPSGAEGVAVIRAVRALAAARGEGRADGC